MRQEASGSGYAAGTKIDSQRSRAELARLMTRYGVSEFVVLEHDANATIRFALHGKYVQYVLPLPDPDSAFFTHTPTGRPRTLSVQERAYEQAVRQQWRRAVLVMKGKLEAVESGLSSFEREFYGAIMDKEKSDRPPPLLLRRRFRWAPETMLVALCLGVLVPASGGLALGLPAVAVEHLTAPVWGDETGPLDASDEGRSTSKTHTVRLGTSKRQVLYAVPSPRSEVGDDTQRAARPTSARPTSGEPTSADPAPSDGEDSAAESPGPAREPVATDGIAAADPAGEGETDPAGKGEKKSKGEKQEKPKHEAEPKQDKSKSQDKGGSKKQEKPKSEDKGGGKKQEKPKDKAGSDKGADKGQSADKGQGADKSQGADTGKGSDKGKGADKDGKGAGGAANGKK